MNESPQRHQYPHFQPILSRYNDSDPNGHIAGPSVHAFFDTTIQAYLHQHAGLDLQEGAVAGFVVSSSADFFALPSFPDALEVGLRVARVAGSTVEYQLALLRLGETEACAQGRVVQVFVERQSGVPVALPAALQAALDALRRV